MKQIAIVFAIIVVSPLIFGASIYLLRVPICKGKLLQFIRPHIEHFFPPRDLYDGLIDAIVPFNNEDKYEYLFKIKYVGPYRFDMIFDHVDNFNENCVAKAHIDFYLKDELLLSDSISIDKTRAWFDFAVPEQLPIEKRITCKIKFELSKGKCESIRLLLSRLSTE